ncbi:rhodanese-like domain-containing protein [Streptomyces caeni]|uniref:Rhodanese-like domain-containing protein n=1 Tax=Streptomyces caeni TaxID=2307231 RepID=A0ABW4IYH5_9ACTN
MAREVTLETFAAAWADGGLVVDVREAYEYAAGHVPGARFMPLSTVLDRSAELPAERRVYVICASGNRSKTATDWMRSRGVDAYSVAGGTRGWTQGGRPVATGHHERTA